MSCRSIMASAAVVFALAIHPAIAKENTGGNWPSQSCGCSGAGKCYIAHRNDGSSKCLPDSGGGGCSGDCIFTKHPALGSSWGGFIFRSPRSGAGGSSSNGGVFAK